MAKYLQERHVVIKGIIDNNLSLKNSGDLPTISFENVSDGAKIFIAIESPKANEEILSQILQSHTVTKVVGYADVERVIKKMVPDADI